MSPFPLKSNDKVGSHIPKDDGHGCKDENHVGQGKKAFKVREVDEVDEIENAKCGDEGRQVAEEHIFCQIRNKDAVQRTPENEEGQVENQSDVARIQLDQPLNIKSLWQNGKFIFIIREINPNNIDILCRSDIINTIFNYFSLRPYK